LITSSTVIVLAVVGRVADGKYTVTWLGELWPGELAEANKTMPKSRAKRWAGIDSNSESNTLSREAARFMMGVFILSATPPVSDLPVFI
jgi:hypothetical protein